VISNIDSISGRDDSTTVTSGAFIQDAGRAERPRNPSGAEADAATAAPPASSDEYSLELPGSAAETKPAAPSVSDSGGAGGGIAHGEDERIIDATAQVQLGAEADEVQDVANDVVEVTDRYHGVVLRSEVSSDEAGASASFELEIPYKNLDAALSDLSGLADVISRTEDGEDITARAVRARKDLARTLDQLHNARIALIRADTREERLVLKARIDSLEATADAYETEFNQVRRQGRFATVSVEVTSSGAASSGDDGNWGLGDALDDAGDVLETIGGIALVSLAILLPLSLVAALVAFTVSRARRRSRENALDR
jgi:hypothetical protein